MTFIDQYAYASSIANMDPKAKALFALMPLIAVLSAHSIAISLFVWSVMALLTIKCAGMPVKKYIRFMLLPLAFLLMGTLTILIQKYSLEEQLLVGLTVRGYQYGVTVQSLKEGLALVFKALAAVSCMYFISFNTPMNHLFGELGRIKQLDVLVSLMELIYRYIFVLWDESERMRTAQESRLGYRDFKTSITSIGTMAAMLFIRAYQRCDRTFAALESRGFDGNLHLLAEEYEPSGTLYVGAVAFGSLLIVITVLHKQGVLGMF